MDKKTALSIMWKQRQAALGKAGNIEVMILEKAGWSRLPASDLWKLKDEHYPHSRETALKMVSKAFDL